MSMGEKTVLFLCCWLLLIVLEDQWVTFLSFLPKAEKLKKKWQVRSACLHLPNEKNDGRHHCRSMAISYFTSELWKYSVLIHTDCLEEKAGPVTLDQKEHVRLYILVGSEKDWRKGRDKWASFVAVKENCKQEGMSKVGLCFFSPGEICLPPKEIWN